MPLTGAALTEQQVISGFWQNAHDMVLAYNASMAALKGLGFAPGSSTVYLAQNSINAIQAYYDGTKAAYDTLVIIVNTQAESYYSQP